ncbi:MAG: hypothetical protein MUE44_25405 [Oscillatoriaceae cyanobacterium Prado104]|jgi:hypothetical protein|nr:hypothetical protein [Oscillatoriaceae cyanobacterium Prado104]
MSAKKLVSAVSIWIKITLGSLLLLLAAILILLPILTFWRVPSFCIGNDALWFACWQYAPQGFFIKFNPISLFAIASFIGLLGIGILPKLKLSQNRHNNRN